MEEFITAKMALLAYGYKFGELMRLAESNIVRRRHRVCDGEDIYTFSREDIIRYAELHHGNS